MKVALAARLRAETTMTVGWIAERLAMGTRGYLNHLLYRRRKQGGELTISRTDPFFIRRRVRVRVDAVFHRNRKAVESSKSTAGRPGLVGRARSLEHGIPLEHAERVERLKASRAIE